MLPRSRLPDHELPIYTIKDVRINERRLDMYVTFYRNKPVQTFSFEDLWTNFGTNNMELAQPEYSPFPRKLTIYNQDFNWQNQPMNQMKEALYQVRNRVWDIYNRFQNCPEEFYDTFLIPKHSGGTRRIDAPKTELKGLMRELKGMFENQLHFLAHDRAFAYVPMRSTKEALMEHQKNESKWFLKLDMKDFFPNCTEQIIMGAMHRMFPFKVLLDTRTISRTS
jgi:hypothetical protein